MAEARVRVPARARRRAGLVAAPIALAAAAAGIVLAGAHRGHPAVRPAATGSALVVRTDLASMIQVSGALGFAGSSTIVDQRPGTAYTALPAPGATIRRGQAQAVQVSQPSSILAARAAARTAFTGLFLGLGAVAVLVGGVGIGNIMVISVLERRAEIGLRRALGATRWQVGLQFLVESLLLSALGGVAGAVAGAAATAGYAAGAGQPTVVPPAGVAAGLGVALITGVLAGVYPAARAARLAPAEALRAA